MAALLNLDPFRNAYDVFLDKTGKVDMDIQSKAAEAGTMFESGVLDWAENQLGPLDRGPIHDGHHKGVEIILDQLKDVLYVPVQAVVDVNGRNVCYLLDEEGNLISREVEVGAFNNNYIEIKSGLAEGDKVSLASIRQVQTMDQMEQQKRDLIEKVFQNESTKEN